MIFWTPPVLKLTAVSTFLIPASSRSKIVPDEKTKRLFDTEPRKSGDEKLNEFGN
jgi:hypothetical protein